MGDNLFNQFPRQPELQPLAPPPARGQQILSLILIVTGLILLGTGGWMFYQYQLEASQPPPARIIEAPVAGLTETPPPQPSPTRTVVASPSRQAGDTIKPANTAAATPTSEARRTPTVEPVLPASQVTPAPNSPSPTATSTPEATPTSQPAAAPAPSLEDNPLVLPDDTAIQTNEIPAPVPTSVETSPITRVVAESIGLDAPVVAVGWTTITNQSGMPVNVWTVADYAAGWHKNSTLPGQGGNIVLSGHHNIKGEVFRHTIELNVGDIVTLYEGDQAFQYAVADKFIVKDKGEPDAVRRENAKWIGPFNEERLTLVTCWPYTNNTHRAIVIAKPVTHSE